MSESKIQNIAKRAGTAVYYLIIVTFGYVTLNDSYFTIFESEIKYEYLFITWYILIYTTGAVAGLYGINLAYNNPEMFTNIIEKYASEPKSPVSFIINTSLIVGIMFIGNHYIIFLYFCLCALIVLYYTKIVNLCYYHIKGVK